MSPKALWVLFYLSLIPQSLAFNMRHELGKCLVAIQMRAIPTSQKVPLKLVTNLEAYFGKKAPSQRLNAFNHKAPETLKDTAITQFRGLVVTQEQLDNIAQNGLDPTLSTQNRNSFGSLPDAIHYSSTEMNNRKYSSKDHIMIIVQLTPEWTESLRPDLAQASTEYTRRWIPPQGIQSIMAIDPNSTERFQLAEITVPPRN